MLFPHLKPQEISNNAIVMFLFGKFFTPYHISSNAFYIYLLYVLIKSVMIDYILYRIMYLAMLLILTHAKWETMTIQAWAAR